MWLQNVNSLLLSVKNLENFNKASKNIFEHQTIYETQHDHKRQMLENIRNILAIDDISITNDKPKDTDQLSTVSSMTNTNFTGKLVSHLKRLITNRLKFFSFSFQWWHSTTLIARQRSPKRFAVEAIKWRFSFLWWLFSFSSEFPVSFACLKCVIKKCRDDESFLWCKWMMVGVVYKFCHLFLNSLDRMNLIHVKIGKKLRCDVIYDQPTMFP